MWESHLDVCIYGICLRFWCYKKCRGVEQAGVIMEARSVEVEMCLLEIELSNYWRGWKYVKKDKSMVYARNVGVLLVVVY